MWLWERAAGLIEIFVGCHCSASPQWSTSPKGHPFLALLPSSISFHTGTKSTAPVASSLTSFHFLFTDVALILVKPNSFKYSQIFPKIQFSSTVALAYNNHSRKLIFISSFQPPVFYLCLTPQPLTRLGQAIHLTCYLQGSCLSFRPIFFAFRLKCANHTILLCKTSMRRLN